MLLGMSNRWSLKHYFPITTMLSNSKANQMSQIRNDDNNSYFAIFPPN